MEIKYNQEKEELEIIYLQGKQRWMNYEPPFDEAENEFLVMMRDKQNAIEQQQSKKEMMYI